MQYKIYKAFEIALLINNISMQKVARAFLEIYGGKERERDFEYFKFHFCHRITKQIKNRTLHDIMHDLSNNTARTSSKLKTEGLSEGLHVPLMSQACPKGGTFYKINTSSSSNQEKKEYQE